MIGRYEAYIDDVALSSIHPMLRVLDISEDQPEIQANIVQLANGSRAYVNAKTRQPCGVSINFELHLYSVDERKAVCRQVAQWARGRVLRISDRPNQRLFVFCDRPPVISSAKQWTAPISMHFAAYNLPYWQEITPCSVTVTGQGKYMYVPGNVPTDVDTAKVDVTATITGQDWLTVAVGATRIYLYQPGSAGDVVTLTHDENGILSIKNGNTSILDKRVSIPPSVISSDDLLAECGETNAFSMDGATECIFSVRGLWL